MQNAHDSRRTSHWSALDPYAQLVKSLMPRTACICVFDAQGELRWCSEQQTVSELSALIDEALPVAATEPESVGQMRTLHEAAPVYLFWVRGDAQQLLAIIAVVCREGGEQKPFSLVHSFLAPALECLRRELASRANILDLSRALHARDRDVELLMSVQGEQEAAGGADELRTILKNAAEHMCSTLAALTVPEKSLVLMCPNGAKPPDGALLARMHRQLLAMAQMRREPLIINRVAATANQAAVPYRILSCPLRHPSGRIMGVLTMFRPDSAPEYADRDARFADLLARKSVQAIEASYDATSGLLTRTSFEQRATAAVGERANGAGRTPSQWSVLYIDSDLLHVVNESFGMHVGDTVIAQLGELLRRRLPPGALAARISGDRFAVLLPTGLDDAAQFGESLREGAEQVGRFFGDARLRVSVSIGVAEYGSHDELLHTLAAAESACKAAKDRGRNRVETYADGDTSIVQRFSDINVAGNLREAIANDRLRLEGQLILPLGTDGEARPHFELLLRMLDHEGDTLGPDRFLSAANRYQLMPEIDRWVLHKAIELLKPHAELLAQRPVVFAINFSGQSIGDEEFDEFLVASIESSGLDPRVFCFELTESAAVANIRRAEVLMRRLRKLGSGVALDDFGTGLSSLSYLRQLPVTMLKIDGSFVRDILKDPRSESMVRVIAQLARGMGLVTVAEYVETEELLRRVATLGVDFGQGFAIARPAPIAEFLANLPVFAAASPVCYAPAEHLPPDGSAEERVVNLH